VAAEERAGRGGGGAIAETLRQWVKRATAEGLDSVAARKPGSGARAKLSADQRERVLGWADADPRATIPGLRRRIGEAWGIALSGAQASPMRGRGFRYGGAPEAPRSG
jgi:transposase